MNYLSIILAAAKSVKIPASLLVAVCMHESKNFTITYNPDDGGSPSYGICQVKEDTAAMFGFTGNPLLLMDPKINAKYASLYLRFQTKRYGQNWIKLVSAYNAGTYYESKKSLGCPRNLEYIKNVQKKLPKELKHKLNCGRM